MLGSSNDINSSNAVTGSDNGPSGLQDIEMTENVPGTENTEAGLRSAPGDNSIEENNDDDDDNNRSSTLSERLLPPDFRDMAARHIDNIGRRFNVLDRVFRHENNGNNSSSSEGRGALFDGVFSNLTAKPDNNNNDGNENENDTPPTYDEAAADLVPSYYGMDLSSSEMYDEICIEGLPVGNTANLIWNIIVSTSFQFIGFLITYMLHTSHAAKQGSRFGLGLTFLGYGYSMIPNNVVSKVGKHKILNRIEPSDPNNYDDLRLNSKATTQDDFESHLDHGIEEEKQSLPLLAVAISLLGAFITIKSIVDFVKIKRKEHRYLSQESSV